MRKTILGRTGLNVSVLALGGHEYLPSGKSRGFNENMALAVAPGHIGEGYGGPKRVALLKTAYDLGINLFDVTIDSEKEALGRNLRDNPPPYDIVVQTRPEGMCYSYDKNNRSMLDLGKLRAELQRGLKLIRRDAIDLLNVGLLAWSIDNDPEYLQKLAYNIGELKREGLIRFAVADSFSGERLYLAMMACGAFDVVNLDLSIGDATCLETVVPRARQQNLGVTAREVFFKSELFRIGAAAGIEDRGLLARAALKWVAQQQPDTVLMGVDNSEQLIANARSYDTPMNEEEALVLSAVRAHPDFATFETAKRVEFFELPEDETA